MDSGITQKTRRDKKMAEDSCTTNGNIMILACSGGSRGRQPSPVAGVLSFLFYLYSKKAGGKDLKFLVSKTLLK